MNNSVPKGKEYKILFLHHSTGSVVFDGGRKSISILGHKIGGKSDVPNWFDDYNKSKGTSYQISQLFFPKDKPYGWNNYPYDYYTIWVKHAGNQPYMEEPTLEILTKKYNMIILKHCYPVGDLLEDTNQPDIESPEKRIENYKLQYLALKQKMLEFPNTKFLIWTGAVRIASGTNPASAARAKSFFEWVRNEWDTEHDNIYLFDFEKLETDGGLYLKNEYAINSGDSHPGKAFAKRAAPLFCQRITDVIENDGTKTTLTGVYK
ncbi:MAG: hypothetical protein WCM93_11455 [Bacteroidota bacterium]